MLSCIWTTSNKSERLMHLVGWFYLKASRTLSVSRILIKFPYQILWKSIKQFSSYTHRRTNGWKAMSAPQGAETPSNICYARTSTRSVPEVRAQCKVSLLMWPWAKKVYRTESLYSPRLPLIAAVPMCPIKWASCTSILRNCT